MTATLSAREWGTVVVIAFIIVAVFTALLVWGGEIEDCREAGFDRRATLHARVYCIRLKDGVVEGRSLEAVRELAANVAERGCP